MRPAELDFTLLCCTYNRSADLQDLLASALAQETGGAFTFEVLVVDNNSNDDTRAVVERFTARHGELLRYVFEPRQGKSHALNTGIEAARGRVYTIADDDLVYPPDYLRKVQAAFAEHPEASVIAGKVLPLWKSSPPEWLTERNGAAIAITNFGPEAFETGDANPVCLLAGAYRRDDVVAVDAYKAELGALGRSSGVEDADVMMRLYATGRRGVYRPEIEVFHKVPPQRMTRAFHRRWHRNHGRHYAVMREAKLEASGRRLLAVPGHLYRAALRDLASLVRCELQRKGDEAFWYETRLCFFAGFFVQRVRTLLGAGDR